MQQASFSIDELQALVEKLSSLVSAMEQPLEAAPQHIFNSELRGRALSQWLEDLWPASPPWQGDGLSESYLDSLHRNERVAKDKLIAEIAHRERLLAKARQRLGQLRRQPESLKHSARQKARDAAAQAQRMQELASLQRQKAKTTASQAKVLTAWLQSLKPQGLSRFVDATGRRVSPSQLEEAGRRPSAGARGPRHEPGQGGGARRPAHRGGLCRQGTPPGRGRIRH